MPPKKRKTKEEKPSGKIENMYEKIPKHLLEKAENEGFKDVFISINHLGSKIKNFLKKDSIKNKLAI